MSFGVSYEEYTRIFNFDSSPVAASTLSQYSTLFAVILVIIAFFSLSLALLVDKKSQSPFNYFFHAILASLSIGLGSVYVANSFGVYV
mmetsp:Transcript_2128/g.2083  ORF Transcript_2128/g.2083 Transcript_2128/m.2083 type:complete len:88 (-) Transcript_2128:198-461(-)